MTLSPSNNEITIGNVIIRGWARYKSPCVGVGINFESNVAWVNMLFWTTYIVW